MRYARQMGRLATVAQGICPLPCKAQKAKALNLIVFPQNNLSNTNYEFQLTFCKLGGGGGGGDTPCWALCR